MIYIIISAAAVAGWFLSSLVVLFFYWVHSRPSAPRQGYSKSPGQTDVYKKIEIKESAFKLLLRKSSILWGLGKFAISITDLTGGLDGIPGIDGEGACLLLLFMPFAAALRLLMLPVLLLLLPFLLLELLFRAFQR